MSPTTLLSILALNDDIFDLLLPKFDKTSLLRMSRTCSLIRKHCLPIVFREVSVESVFLPLTKRFLPKTLWPHVRVLNLVDECPDIYNNCLPDYMRRPLRFAPDRLLCGVYDGAFLADALKQMPNLRTIRFQLCYVHVHGLPWSVLQPILSLPHLREFAIGFHCFAPETRFKDALTFDSPAPLTSFESTLHDDRWEAPDGPVEGYEQIALGVVLHGIHQTLQRLVLTTDHAPLDDICFTLSWPCLRELVLRGEFRAVGDPPLPLVRLLANMPKLRILELMIAQPEGVDPLPIWPPDLPSTVMPWPELQELTVSCPQADDKIYASLPYVLRRLSLRYYPHLSTELWMFRLDPPTRIWQWPLLGSSDVLRILRACHLPMLDDLELEYVENDADEDLLRHLSVALSTITSLKIRRYRREGATDVPLKNICGALAALPRLRLLSLHLDFDDTPQAYWRQMRIGIDRLFVPEEIRAFKEKLLRVANVLASALCPSLETVRLARSWEGDGATWLEYDVIREKGKVPYARFVYNKKSNQW
ncbi:hypothetical protein BD413DRAFT_133012 [Trametes elegans]|nr:hypothetical protein BD413DRAFT_133012 [Trametes elegans]